MSELSACTDDVLSLPSPGIQQFRDFAVAHPFLVEAKDRLMEGIMESAPNSLIFVFGPTGVGKTTLLSKVRQLLSPDPSPNLESDPAYLPVVCIEAAPPDARTFSWRAHFKRMLYAMNEPLVDFKRRFGSVDRSAQSMAPYPNDRGLTADYHYAVEQALRYRRPKAVLIDEAQHLFTLASGRRIEDQLNVLKSLANRSSTVHVLCGTYDLLRARNLSGQLSRRSIDIHFPRYDTSKASARHTFEKILQTFAAQMPLPQPPDLAGSWEFLYERSIGCVGIIKDWLVRALSTAVRASSPTLTLKHLEKHALSVSQCDRLIEEAARGESQVHEDADALAQLRLRLGLPEPVHASEKQRPTNVDHARQAYPGQRCPKRDAVGVSASP